MKKRYFATSKDKKDWIAFTKHFINIYDKDAVFDKQNTNTNKIRKLDLHGFSLKEANKIVKKFTIESINYGCKKILEFKKIDNIYKVTVNFVSEIITCVKDKNNQIIEGNPDTKKTVNDVWRFAKNMWSQNPTWYLIDTSDKY